MFQHLSELQIGLLQKHILDFTGDVDGDLAVRAKESFEWLIVQGSPDITINFCSKGGSIITGFDIFHFIADYSGKVTGKVIGYCCSSAVTILQACDERVAYSIGEILVHRAKRELSMDCFTEDMHLTKKGKRLVEKSHKVEEMMIKVLLLKSGLSRKKLMALLNRDKHILADEALEYGFIDRMLDSFADK